MNGGEGHNFLHKNGNEVTEKGGKDLTGEGQNASKLEQAGNWPIKDQDRVQVLIPHNQALFAVDCGW